MAAAIESSIEDYQADGERRARALPNRGPIRFENGRLAKDIVDAYRRYGFYVLTDVIGSAELEDLRTDLDDVLDRAPTAPDSDVDAKGRPAIGSDMPYRIISLAKPLSDPFGGTEAANGRYEAKMVEPTPDDDAPAFVPVTLGAMMEVMDSAYRLYGHPDLLRIAASINGDDFTPFTDAIWIKEARMGTSTAWHQDGTTLWNHPEWDEGIHGFNFMAQLFDTCAGNALWVVPGTHKDGKIDIRAKVRDNGSDRLPNAVPMLAGAGDVVMCNRQILHCSFPNQTDQRRVTVVFGFHRRSSVLNVESAFGRKDGVRYDAAYIETRSRLIPMAQDARRKRFPDESAFVYAPFADEPDANRDTPENRDAYLKEYPRRALGL